MECSDCPLFSQDCHWRSGPKEEPCLIMKPLLDLMVTVREWAVVSSPRVPAAVTSEDICELESQIKLKVEPFARTETERFLIQG